MLSLFLLLYSLNFGCYCDTYNDSSTLQEENWERVKKLVQTEVPSCRFNPQQSHLQQHTYQLLWDCCCVDRKQRFIVCLVVPIHTYQGTTETLAHCHNNTDQPQAHKIMSLLQQEKRPLFVRRRKHLEGKTVVSWYLEQAGDLVVEQQHAAFSWVQGFYLVLVFILGVMLRYVPRRWLIVLCVCLGVLYRLLVTLGTAKDDWPMASSSIQLPTHNKRLTVTTTNEQQHSTAQWWSKQYSERWINDTNMNERTRVLLPGSFCSSSATNEQRQHVHQRGAHIYKATGCDPYFLFAVSTREEQCRAYLANPANWARFVLLNKPDWNKEVIKFKITYKIHEIEAIFKPPQAALTEAYAEYLSYKIDRLIGLGRIPTTVWCRVPVQNLLLAMEAVINGNVQHKAKAWLLRTIQKFDLSHYDQQQPSNKSSQGAHGRFHDHHHQRDAEVFVWGPLQLYTIGVIPRHDSIFRLESKHDKVSNDQPDVSINQYFDPAYGVPLENLEDNYKHLAVLQTADTNIFDFLIRNTDRRARHNNHVVGGCLPKATCRHPNPDQAQRSGCPRYILLDQGQSILTGIPLHQTSGNPLLLSSLLPQPATASPDIEINASTITTNSTFCLFRKPMANMLLRWHNRITQSNGTDGLAHSLLRQAPESALSLYSDEEMLAIDARLLRLVEQYHLCVNKWGKEVVEVS